MTEPAPPTVPAKPSTLLICSVCFFLIGYALGTLTQRRDLEREEEIGDRVDQLEASHLENFKTARALVICIRDLAACHHERGSDGRETEDDR